MVKIKGWKKWDNQLQWSYQSGDRWLRVDHLVPSKGWSVWLHLDDYNQGQIGGFFKTKSQAVKFATDYMKTTTYMR